MITCGFYIWDQISWDTRRTKRTWTCANTYTTNFFCFSAGTILVPANICWAVSMKRDPRGEGKLVLSHFLKKCPKKVSFHHAIENNYWGSMYTCKKMCTGRYGGLILASHCWLISKSWKSSSFLLEKNKLLLKNIRAWYFSQLLIRKLVLPPPFFFPNYSNCTCEQVLSETSSH